MNLGDFSGEAEIFVDANIFTVKSVLNGATTGNVGNHFGGLLINPLCPCIMGINHIPWMSEFW